MSKTIWKFHLGPNQKSIGLPRGSSILCVQVQNDQPYIWILVDPSPMSEYEIYGLGIYATGEPMPDDPGRYVGTFQVNEGSGILVFHVFDKGVAG